MIELTRVPDWEQRLTDCLDNWRTKRLEWGTHDCAHFACAAIEATTGTNLRPHFPGYSTEAAGRELIDKAGGIAACAVSVLGDAAPAAQAQRGDIVHVQVGQHEWLAVCTGQQALGLGKMGLIPARPEHFVQCWRVG
jgi:hypothetical protein